MTIYNSLSMLANWLNYKTPFLFSNNNLYTLDLTENSLRLWTPHKYVDGLEQFLLYVCRIQALWWEKALLEEQSAITWRAACTRSLSRQRSTNEDTKHTDKRGRGKEKPVAERLSNCAAGSTSLGFFFSPAPTICRSHPSTRQQRNITQRGKRDRTIHRRRNEPTLSDLHSVIIDWFWFSQKIMKMRTKKLYWIDKMCR